MLQAEAVIRAARVTRTTITGRVRARCRRPLPSAIIALFAIVLLAGVFACSKGDVLPVEIVPNEDACSVCRMAISQLQFAAELVTSSGHAEVFDDVGCLAKWLQEHGRPDGAAAFVVDYGTGDWLRCEDAAYVSSSTLPSPMGYGLVAFGDGARAEAAARELGGVVVTWDQVMKQGQRQP